MFTIYLILQFQLVENSNLYTFNSLKCCQPIPKYKTLLELQYDARLARKEERKIKRESAKDSADRSSTDDDEKSADDQKVGKIPARVVPRPYWSAERNEWVSDWRPQLMGTRVNQNHGTWPMMGSRTHEPVPPADPDVVCFMKVCSV